MTASPSSLILPALNHLLHQEPWGRQQLQPHAGKVACIDFSVLALRIKITSHGYLQTVTDDVAANVTIRINPADLPLIMQNQQRAMSYVKLEGDADLAQALSELGKNLRWDAEQQLSHIVGDIFARRLIRTGNAMLTSLQSNAQKIQENLAEYFLEENPLLLRPASVSEFSQQVRCISDDVERLIKRVEKCEKTLSRIP